MNDEAKRLLAGLQAVAEARAIATPTLRSPWVFPSENPAHPIDPYNFYRRHYLKAVKDAKLDGVTWHTLRHTFASRLAMSGATEYDIALCLRHAGTSLVRRYAHLSPTHLRSVVERVSNYGKPTPPEEAKEATISNGTVTGTGTASQIEENSGVQVVEIWCPRYELNVRPAV